MKYTKLLQASRAILEEIEAKIGETVAIGVINDDYSLGSVLGIAEGQSGFSFHIDIGYQFPLHASAPGKILVAHLPKHQFEKALFQIEYFPFTKNTISNKQDYILELENIKKTGYSIDLSEQMEGCHCISMPIYDPIKNTVIAAIWATGPSNMLPVDTFEKTIEILTLAASKITKELSYLYRVSNNVHNDDILLRAEQIMKKTLNTPLDTKALAETFFVSYSWFRQEFKRMYGLSPASYHMLQRINKAKELLADSQLTIKDIASELGFKNQNQFSATFKLKAGCAPLVYKENYK